MTNTATTWRIGTRQSELALKQTEMVKAQLLEMEPAADFPVISMTTTGDQQLNQPLHQLGGKALFTKELEFALLNDEVDLVVHSLKDLPTTLPEGLQLASVLEREVPTDAFIPSLKSREKGWTVLENLPPGSVIGTSSVRRIAQLKRHFPQLSFTDIRGNLNTRLRKLDADDDKYHAIILAYAGVHRLGWTDRITQLLAPSAGYLHPNSSIPTCEKPILYAVGQGALAIECRQNDGKTLPLVDKLTHKPTWLAALAERELLFTLEGGCSVPIGVCTKWVTESLLSLQGCVCSLDGKQYLYSDRESTVSSDQEARLLGKTVAQLLIDQGADKLLLEIRAAKAKQDQQNP